MVPSATAFFCFCLVAVYAIDGEDSRKFKRDAVSGLVSFPRIGRGDRLWKIGPQEMKRQSLVSFPRTGKRDSTEADQLPDLLWLGPERKETANLWDLVRVKDVPVLLARSGKDGYGKRLTADASEDAG